MTWGGLATSMYTHGARYQLVAYGFLIGLAAPLPLWFAHRAFPKLRLDYWNTAIIFGYMYHLSQGTHSALLFHFITGFISQFWLRKYRTNWFIKYNYILRYALSTSRSTLFSMLTSLECWYRWWSPSHQLHPHLRRLRRGWKGCAVPQILG